MKLCRFDEDRLGVVIGDKVHDVTEAQREIRAAARYDMKGDAVIEFKDVILLAGQRTHGVGISASQQQQFINEAR